VSWRAGTSAVQALLCLLHAVVVLTGVGTDRARGTASDLLMLVLALWLTARCAATARGSAGRERLAWAVLAVGSAAWTAAQADWLRSAVLDRQVPGLGDSAWQAGWVALPLLGAGALVLLARRRESTARPLRPLLVALDATALFGAVVVLAWPLALADLLSGQAAALGVLWALSSVLLATTALVVLTAGSELLPRPGKLAAAGLLLLCVADLGYTGQAAVTVWAPGTANDIGYVGGLSLIVAGASLAARGQAVRPAPRPVLQLLLLVPYAPVALAAGVVAQQLLVHRHVGWPVLSMTVGLMAVTLVRQVLTHLENVDLLEHLAQRERELRRLAYSDPLTGLGNRTLLLDRLASALTPAAGGGPPRLAVLYADLDDFKLINDTHGHEAGDRVLCVVAERLAALAGPLDTVVRLGGDEFALLLLDRQRPDEVAEQVLAAATVPVQVGPRRFLVGASVGLVEVEGAGETAGTLLSHADIALYVAKTDGKGRVAAVRGQDRALAARQVRLRELVARPDLSEFTVVYQPVVDLRSGQIRGVEALLRWTSPEVGVVPPDVFVPLAERAGSIGVLGRHVLETALDDLCHWRTACPGVPLTAGVNLSPLQLDDADLLRTALDGLAARGLAPDQLVLEVTEQALVDDLEAAVAAVAALRAAGVSVAIDDFGTGYSSLRYLDRFDVDVLKIDRSFVGKITDGSRTLQLVRSVVDLCGQLRVQAIAEGVETPEQLELLREMGCELGQGYLFSRPVAAARVPELLAGGGVLAGAGEGARAWPAGPQAPAGCEVPGERRVPLAVARAV
jgi:diguanylate cyclase